VPHGLRYALPRYLVFAPGHLSVACCERSENRSIARMVSAVY